MSTESLRCVKFGARFLVVGWASTPNVARGKGKRGAPNANTLPTNLIMMKGLRVLGCPAVISTQFDPTLRPARHALLQQWVDAGLVVPHVSHTFALADIREAMAARWNREVVGGCCVHPPVAALR